MEHAQRQTNVGWFSTPLSTRINYSAVTNGTPVSKPWRKINVGTNSINATYIRETQKRP
jgi:hypothetical protein